jgi:HlyD family secretion protein
VNRYLIVALGILATAACTKPKAESSIIRTEAVRRRNITVSAEATGVVEPVNVVEVKSKASGQINRMTVETGTDVMPGDLLVQLDTRDVDQQYVQAKGDRDAAKSRFDVALETRRRQRELFQQRVITEQEFQQGLADSSNAATALIRADAALNLAEQRREDATVRAPIAGTIIDKTVSVGSVITSSTGSMGAGTTLLKMADLSRVRVRAHFNETDIGNVQPGLAATVTVDAFPDAPFRGIVEKIEPIAVVQQSVTMFPVLIALDNAERKLKPGMNGEVAVRLDERDNVLAVASDAIRTLREAEANALLLKLNPDSVRKAVDAQVASLSGLGGPVAENGPARTSPGDVDISSPAFQPAADQQQAGQQQAGQQQQGGQQRGGRGGPPPTAQECAPIATAYQKNPKVKAQLDSLRASMRTEGADRQAIQAAQRAAYATLGVDAQLAGRCNFVLNPQQGGRGGNAGGNAGGAPTGRTGAGAPQAGTAPNGATGGAPFGTRGAGGGGFAGGGRRGGRGGDQSPTGPRTALVFLSVNGKYEPRVIRTGLASYDYTEVLAGLEEGDNVVLLTTAQLQQQQQQQRDQMRARQGGPLGTPAGGGGPPGGGGGGRGPGGGGGGGRGPGGGN